MKENKIRWFAAIICILLSATIAYGAIPQNTLRQNAGITMPTVNATVEYYRGPLNYTQWILNKALVADPENYTSSLLHGSKTFIGFNTDFENYTNYFLCDGSSDGAQVQAALDFSMAGGGEIFADEGLYDIDDQNLNLTNVNHESVIIRGQGWGASEWNLANGNGTVFHFTAPYGFVDKDDSSTNFGQLIISNLGLHFTGKYEGTARPVLIRTHVIHWENVRVSINCGIPNNAIAVLLGSTGPPAEPFTYKNVQFIDQRLHGNFSFLVRFYGEMIDLEGCSVLTDVSTTSSGGFQGPFDTPRLFRLNQVTHSTIRHFLIFTGSTFDGDGTQYEFQWFYGDPADSHWYFDNSEFFASSDISGGHISTSDGDVWLDGTFPVLAEGGNTPMDLVLHGAGDVFVRFIGDGYEHTGTATILNGETNVNITHTLVGTPTSTILTGSSWQTKDLYGTRLNATHFQIMANVTVTGNTDVYYAARYTKTG